MAMDDKHDVTLTSEMYSALGEIHISRKDYQSKTKTCESIHHDISLSKSGEKSAF